MVSQKKTHMHHGTERRHCCVCGFADAGVIRQARSYFTLGVSVFIVWTCPRHAEGPYILFFKRTGQGSGEWSGSRGMRGVDPAVLGAVQCL